MRKGYLLIEMIFVLLILGMLSVPLTRLFRLFAYELPRDNRLVQEDLILLSAAGCIRADVASATTVSEKPGRTPGETSLAVQKTGGVVSYDFGNGRIIRRKDTIVQGAIPEETVWSIPHGKVEIQVWSKNQKGYAVELITFVEDKDLGHTRRKMANNYVFFAGVSGEAVK